MNELLDKLGAVARKAAGTVSTEVNVAAEEQKIKEAYQALGKLYYQAKRDGKALTGPEFDSCCDRIDESVKRVKELKSSKRVVEEVYVDDEDFVTVED